MIDYMRILTNYYKGTSVSSSDAFDYSSIVFDDIPNAPSKVEMDSRWLDLLKLDKITSINKRTDELIDSGFTYGSLVFDMNLSARVDWLGLDMIKAILTYPYTISSMDDSELDLVDITDVHNFFLTGLGLYQSYKASGRSLKNQVNLVVDETGLNAVVDNR